MFEKKENKPAATNVMNQFGQGTIITGDVSTEGDVRIDGRVTGTVTSKSKVVIGVSGIIEGNILCQNAYVDGKVSGNVEVSELLILSSTANVEGDIKIKKLVVQEGARFNGSCSMATTAAKSEVAAAGPKTV